MNPTGTFYGIGIGPGEPGMLPVVAWERLLLCGAIFVPRATSQEASTARMCLPPNTIPEERFHEVEFDMSKDHDVLLVRYRGMAASIAAILCKGVDVAYLTLGDTMTYSTFNYTLRALTSVYPQAKWKIFPGVTSYAALAAATGFALGEGKERVQILPCPEEMKILETVVRCNDVVVLMKIGHRLPSVLELLGTLGLLDHSAFGSRVGMKDEICLRDLTPLLSGLHSGYLSTLLIRNPNPQYS